MSTNRTCIDCGAECYGRRCLPCRKTYRTRRAYRRLIESKSERDPVIIPAPVNPIVVPPWVECPELDPTAMALGVTGVCGG